MTNKDIDYKSIWNDRVTIKEKSDNNSHTIVIFIRIGISKTIEFGYDADYKYIRETLRYFYGFEVEFVNYLIEKIKSHKLS